MCVFVTGFLFICAFHSSLDNSKEEIMKVSLFLLIAHMDNFNLVSN